MDVSTEHQELFVVLREIISNIKFILMAFYSEHRARNRLCDHAQTSTSPAYTIKTKICKQIEHLHDLILVTDETCVKNLRMSRNAFGWLCFLLENVVGLSSNKNVKSGYTISAHFNNVLTALLKLHTLFLVKPAPIEDDFTNERWKWFKGCLGALDGNYIPLRVAQKDKGRYRNRKGDISTNVLAVCDTNMNYIYMLCGWEGLVADSRVLKNAITRENGFRIPEGNYYLCDSGYTNGEGFLAPYRGVRMNRMRGGVTNESTTNTCRRCWTQEEEKVLANAMRDLVVKGYKADNGFKNGYQNLLEQPMMQAFPGTTIRVEPHINSRITVWRKNYGSISTMLSRSGFGFNNTTNMITMNSQEVWDNYIKDRATGKDVEGFADVVQQLLNNNVNNEQGKENEEGGDYVPVFNNSQFDEVESMSVSYANTSDSSKSQKRKRKRKVVDENDDCFINLMSKFYDKTDDKLGDICKRIRFEHYASLSRKMVFEAIGEVTSLDMEEMILVSHLIVNNMKNMDLFFSLPNNGRKTMVKMILKGKFPRMDTIG
ncbi:hypothetical protein BUALT_Bualt16G0123600 [Buddleja alternifolia]|uniref:Transposase n=1 Tax=Buddleja alternifolia TaxID=168488 RepID=A0AAV6WHI8_9LAMI|nr:hypothetical protein BUALT_Bualt16G0123600 [Buddleja alternifolia]